MRAFSVALAILVVSAGCLSGQPATIDADNDVAAGQTPIACFVFGAGGDALAGAECTFEFGGRSQVIASDGTGMAAADVPTNIAGVLTAHAPGVPSKSVALNSTHVRNVRFTLDGLTGTAPHADSPGLRVWSEPVTVKETPNDEPMITGDSQGTLYYTAIPDLFRSTDGGATWQDISPAPPEALPSLISDTSISVGPDDSLWFTRWWAYFGSTIGCVSTDRGDSWTCDNLALPGATDRMWIVGLSAQEAYVHSTLGFYTRQWAHTTNGAAKFVPTAAGPGGAVGNMVYDIVHDAVWQPDWSNPIGLLRIDGHVGGPPPRIQTDVPGTQTAPDLRVDSDGTLWLTGEPPVGDGSGSRSVVVARSVDQGATWDHMPVMMGPATATFSFMSTGPPGRAAAVYYGAPDAGLAAQTFSAWGLWVAETEEADAVHPTWIETLVDPHVHDGVICAGLGCGETSGDPNGRYSLDFIGIWIDVDGFAHVGYADDTEPAAGGGYVVRSLYSRQVAATR